MENVINFLAKFAATIIALIFIEGIFTLGYAFEFESYNWIGWTIQVCLVILCLRVAMIKDWNGNEW